MSYIDVGKCYKIVFRIKNQSLLLIVSNEIQWKLLELKGICTKTWENKLKSDESADNFSLKIHIFKKFSYILKF